MDQSQQTNSTQFMQQFGQLRLTPMQTASKEASGSTALDKVAGNTAQVPTGTNGKTDTGAPSGSDNKNTAQGRGAKGNGGSSDNGYLPYLVGPAALAAGAAGMKGYLDSRKGAIGSEVSPDMVVTPVTNERVVVRPGEQLGYDTKYLGDGRVNTQPGGGLNFNPQSRQSKYVDTPDVMPMGGAGQGMLPNPNAVPNSATPIYAGQGQQPLMLTDQGGAGRQKLADFQAATMKARIQALAQHFKPTPGEISAISKVVK